ncbi:glycosyltransferase family 2 protein [Achromobacter sp. DH1f]|uniref:glycosyltransferase family 2 protein n=1 Tax=Achromobacter sp. DH1f TaxID=1397275 RepID=UPI00068FC0D3|nr:glycosyltransferase family 2 protein [Achromobacter sp. DH1f]
MTHSSATPSVSIVMPAYNAQRYIKIAIDSVLGQTFKDWELLVVDDCSSDDTGKYVLDYQDERIRYIKNPQNLGVAQTRNRAIEAALGKYIAFLDSDDVWLPQKLAAQVALLEKGATISYGSYVRITEDGRPLATVAVPKSLCYGDMLKSNFIGHLTGIYRKDRLPELRFESGGHEDYVFWLRAVKMAGEIHAALPGTPLAYYRVVKNSLSSNKGKAMRWQWKIYRNVLKLSLLRSAYYFVFYVFNALRKRYLSRLDSRI